MLKRTIMLLLSMSSAIYGADQESDVSPERLVSYKPTPMNVSQQLGLWQRIHAGRDELGKVLPVMSSKISTYLDNPRFARYDMEANWNIWSHMQTLAHEMALKGTLTMEDFISLNMQAGFLMDNAWIPGNRRLASLEGASPENFAAFFQSDEWRDKPFMQYADSALFHGIQGREDHYYPNQAILYTQSGQLNFGTFVQAFCHPTCLALASLPTGIPERVHAGVLGHSHAVFLLHDLSHAGAVETAKTIHHIIHTVATQSESCLFNTAFLFLLIHELYPSSTSGSATQTARKSFETMCDKVIEYFQDEIQFRSFSAISIALRKMSQHQAEEDKVVLHVSFDGNPQRYIERGGNQQHPFSITRRPIDATHESVRVDSDALPNGSLAFCLIKRSIQRALEYEDYARLLGHVYGKAKQPRTLKALIPMFKQYVREFYERNKHLFDDTYLDAEVQTEPDQTMQEQSRMIDYLTKRVAELEEISADQAQDIAWGTERIKQQDRCIANLNKQIANNAPLPRTVSSRALLPLPQTTFDAAP